MRILILLVVMSVILAGNMFAAKKLPPLTTVDKVDLNKYTGLWYQMAYFPNGFQPKNAKLTTAEYTLSPKGYVVVKNTAYKDIQGTEVKSDITGKAFVRDKVTNAKLGVQFFWPFKGAYWIILLDEKDYQWAVVSDPSRKYLWILTRKPVIEKTLYLDLLRQITEKNFDLAKLVVTGTVE